jgi:hypothetical protein
MICFLKKFINFVFFHSKRIKNMKRLITILMFVTFCFGYSEEQNSDFRLYGSFYSRPTLDGRDFSDKTHPLFFSLQRVAVGVEKHLFTDVTVTAELMDSRIWGQPQNVRKSIANVDLHQGFLTLKNIFGKPLDLKIGRFEASFNKKVIGIVGWQDVPIAYDGFDLTYRHSDKLTTDFFVFHPYNASKYYAVPTMGYSDPITKDSGYYAPGLTMKYNLTKSSYIQPIFLYETQGPTASTADFSKFTAAIDFIYKENVFDIWVHAGMQNGTLGKKDLSSYGVMVNLGYNLGFVKPVLIFDMNSGTDPKDATEKSNLYWNNFGERHSFFGHGDYFGNMPVATKGLGLNELGLRLIFNEGKKFSGNLEGHYFTTNVSNVDDKSDLGMEFDLILKYAINPKMYIDWGMVAFQPGEITKSLYTPANKTLHEDLGFFSYMRFWFAF